MSNLVKTEIQRLALILASDDDARARMIYAVGIYRSPSRSGELAEEIARIISSEKK